MLHLICILKEASDILNHFEFRRHTHYTQTEFRNFIPEGLHDSFNIGSFFYDAIALKQFQTTASYILLLTRFAYTGKTYPGLNLGLAIEETKVILYIIRTTNLEDKVRLRDGYFNWLIIYYCF